MCSIEVLCLFSLLQFGTTLGSFFKLSWPWHLSRLQTSSSVEIPLLFGFVFHIPMIPFRLCSLLGNHRSNTSISGIRSQVFPFVPLLGVHKWHSGYLIRACVLNDPTSIHKYSFSRNGVENPFGEVNTLASVLQDQSNCRSIKSAFKLGTLLKRSWSFIFCFDL